MSIDVIISPQASLDPSSLTCKVYFTLLSRDFRQVSRVNLHSSENDGFSGLSSRLI